MRELPANGGLYLVAVGVEKPGNLGAMARSAEAAGADALVVAEGRERRLEPECDPRLDRRRVHAPVVEASPRRDRRPRRRSSSPP